jgi:hypothetical protein
MTRREQRIRKLNRCGWIMIASSILGVACLFGTAFNPVAAYGVAACGIVAVMAWAYATAIATQG